MSLEVGPLLRTVRRRPGIWALMVLELAVGVTTIGSLLLSGFWYGESGQQSSGLDEQDLILISTYTPGPDGVDAASRNGAMRDREDADRRLVRALPDVVAATRVTSSILEDRWMYPSLFSVRAGAARRPADATEGAAGWVTYADGQVARALRLRFLAGGLPAGEEADGNGERPVAAVLTRSLAAGLFSEPAAAVGAHLTSERGADVPVSGVVEDVTMRMALVPHHQRTAFFFGGSPIDHDARLIVRVQPGRREAVLSALAAAFAARSGGRYVDIRAFDSSTGAHHRVGQGLLLMMGLFGVMVALIVLLGALAATSFLVAQRTRQIGIRRALGATRGDIVTYFLLESALAAAAGSIIGVASTAGLFVPMRQVFHGIRFRPALLLAAVATLWLGTIIATLIPALRAARVSPSVAGRSL